jgi:threonine dehydrogenase-like Zn-dependent dehydrogenase
VKALQWQGVDKLAVGDVPDPQIRNSGDIIVKVNRTVTCGSDLHLLGGYIPFMAKGDVLGHEFIGEVVETGPDVRRHRAGDRVVVSSFIACGTCWFCDQKLFSLCDNGNTNPAITETLWGQAPGGCFGYSHAMGGNPGSQFPLGALMNKGLTVRGAQIHGQRYIPMLLERMARGELVTEYLATHVMPLAEAPEGYRIFKQKEDNCVRAVFLPT